MSLDEAKAPGSTQPTLGTEPKQPAIMGALHDLHSEIEGLEHAAGALIEKIEPVLNCDSTGDEGAPEPTYGCQLAVEIEAARKRISAVRRSLGDANQRAEL